jgi:hypothetical protein
MNGFVVFIINGGKAPQHMMKISWNKGVEIKGACG